MTENDGARLLARQLLQPGGHFGAHPSQLDVLVDGLAEDRQLAPFGHRPLGDDHDGELGTALLALLDRRRHRFQPERDLRDENRVGTRGDARLEGDPPCVAAHHLDDDHSPVRCRGGEQPIDAFRGEPHGGVEAERLGGLVEIVVDRLGHSDDAQTGFVQPLGDVQRTVAADRHEGVDVADGEQLDELVGAVDLDVRAVRLAHREGRRVATVGGADDRAAEVDDATYRLALELDDATVSVALWIQQPVEPVTDADDVPALIASGQHDGADHGIEPRCVPTAGRHGDAPDRAPRLFHRVNSRPMRRRPPGLRDQRGMAATASPSTRSLRRSPLCPLTHWNVTGFVLTRATSGAQRSALTTGLRAEVRQPLASHLAHHRSRKQLTT